MEPYQKVPAKDLPENLYTCPMPAHADVVSDQPGNCPKCGMKLVPTPSVPHGKRAEAKWRAEHSAGGAPMPKNMPDMPAMKDAPMTTATKATFDR